MVLQIDQALKQFATRRLVPSDEVVDRLLDLRALAELESAVRDVTDTEAL